MTKRKVVQPDLIDLLLYQFHFIRYIIMAFYQPCDGRKFLYY